MSFVVIMVCVAVQWFFDLRSTAGQWRWLHPYTFWIRQKFSTLANGHGLFLVAMVVLPVVIAVSLLLTIIYHVFGPVGYLVLNLALLWYCIDVILLRSGNAKNIATADLFFQSYRKIFAPLMWYYLVGPAGLVLYVITLRASEELTDQPYFSLALGVLDWVPLRLTGLLFALAGNFSQLFKAWVKTLSQGILDCQHQIAAYGEQVLFSQQESLSLLQRALLIWLFVITLITLGGWI